MNLYWRWRAGEFAAETLHAQAERSGFSYRQFQRLRNQVWADAGFQAEAAAWLRAQDLGTQRAYRHVRDERKRA